MANCNFKNAMWMLELMFTWRCWTAEENFVVCEHLMFIYKMVSPVLKVYIYRTRYQGKSRADGVFR